MEPYKKRGMQFLVMLLFVSIITIFTTTSAQAATKKNGFVTSGRQTYYVRNGTKVKGWLTLNGKKYYFNTRTGAQIKGWAKDNTGKKRYFTSKSGVMVTGWIKNSKGQKRYFDPSTGYMKTGWMTINGKKYYLYKPSGILATGWLKDHKGNYRYFTKGKGVMATGWMQDRKKNKRYFSTSDGVMYIGLKRVGNPYYYFYTKTGVMASGWITDTNGNKRYFNTNGQMVTGSKTINGKVYSFNSNGILTVNTDTGSHTVNPSSSKTIKNYLLGALQPVGKALYVWGGGWNDSTRKGLSPRWQQWYNSQDSSYDYNDYRDLSDGNRAKGLDCSGFVGWAAYQVMQQRSGVGYGYTVVAAEVGSYYRSLGWGQVLDQSDLASSNWTLKPGDVGYNNGHTWIVIGQCSDKSVVIVHSTPQAGCQISGTSTPGGNYDSEAVALARKYMSRYSGYTKYNYHTTSGNYIRNGKYLRWNRSTLADPNGYMNKTANQILTDLFR